MKNYLKKVKAPVLDHDSKKVMLSDDTINERKDKILKVMNEYGFSTLVIYADKEHGSSFEYLTGFIPRFEEAVQIFTKDGTSTLLLGNENFNKASRARTESKGILCPLLSLPNQPMNLDEKMSKYFSEATIDTTGKIGVVGWKLLTKDIFDERSLFDVPAFIIEGLEETINKETSIVNGTHLLIGPEIGVRTTNNANEIAFFEYGSSLASDGVLDALNHLEVGKTEQEIGNKLNREGQYNTVVSISDFGERFEKANLYPTDRKLKKGDKVALTVAYKGGLSSRTGYAVSSFEELESVDKNYLFDVVVPYYSAYVYWLEKVKIGVKGSDFYSDFSEFYPPKQYGWELCPGHLVSDEEWLSSPFYDNSNAEVKSGMLFQVDFIPVQPGHQGVSAESTVAVADEALRKEIAKEYPELWARIENRKEYLSQELNIHLSEELLPMCSTLGYLRPLMLDPETALVLEK